MPLAILSGKLTNGSHSLLMYSSLLLFSFSPPHFLGASSLFSPTHKCLFISYAEQFKPLLLSSSHSCPQVHLIFHYQTTKWLLGFSLQERKKFFFLHHLPYSISES